MPSRPRADDGTTVLAVRVPKTLAEAFARATRDRWLTQSEAMTIALRDWLGHPDRRQAKTGRGK
jgi:hypothetical protein